jgi:hypothetical protein
MLFTVYGTKGPNFLLSGRIFETFRSEIFDKSWHSLVLLLRREGSGTVPDGLSAALVDDDGLLAAQAAHLEALQGLHAPRLVPGLAIKNPPKKPTQKTTQKNHSNGFFGGFLKFFFLYNYNTNFSL